MSTKRTIALLGLALLAAGCESAAERIGRMPYGAVSECAATLGLHKPREGGFFFSEETTIDEAVAMHVRAFEIGPRDEAALRACAERTYGARNAAAS